MNKVLYVFSILILISIIISCSEESTTENILYPIVTEYPNFRFFRYEDVPEEQILQLHDSLMAHYDRIVNHLRVTDMPQVDIGVWAVENSDQFYSQMQATIGRIYEGEIGYTPNSTRTNILNDPMMFEWGIVHEFAHLVSLEFEPLFDNNPLWLWEAVAQYESRMIDHPSTWQENERIFPGFDALNEFGTWLPYQWGYVLVSFIIETYGDDAYIDLIDYGGNIQYILGIDEEEFGTLVNAYVQNML